MELLTEFGIIYPQYWTQGVDDTFQQHLSVLKNFFLTSKTVTFDGKALLISEMLSASKLDVEQSLFKLTMKANSEATCSPPLQVDPVVKLWKTLSAFRPFCRLIPEYLKLAQMGSVLVLGSLEDERCFSTLKFLKSCQRNRLGKHLPLVVRMFG